ncbi:LacI family DNA-binding transcriptional regulator [Actinomadura macrotermitis]|uniref:HTH-type transcriptional regulator DegA n=1 Tax=Actinomadura macrotermitis TaxID=2585200 RepID=A0A7K0C2M9_9ACTN|nr:LacI family DNA-binding transcriptional regulator [Actinomadura macrotermitis]MQY07680.1 HTH-type transcriptional regulator DegA [Actinomadura macrotermitis]
MSHPTLEDVAARAGVSRALVSLVMRGSPKVGKERREAVLKAARELGYRPNVMARGLAAGRTGIVGVLLGDLHEPVYAAIHDGLAAAAARRSVRVLLTTGGGRPARERAAVEQLLDLRPDGMVLAGPRIAAAEIERAAAGCPVAVVGRSLRSDRVDQVTGDDAAAVERAVARLVALGHRRVACLDAGPGSGRPARDALERAYRAAMEAAGLAPAVRPPGEPAGPWHGPGAPTAVLALGDSTGTAALAALYRAGLSVPGDVSLIVHGDPPGAAAAGVTTAAPPPRELGGLAMGALLDRIDAGTTAGGRRITVPPVVTERATTAPPRGTRG